MGDAKKIVLPVLLTMVLWIIPESHATTIVGIWTPGSVVIAADSTGTIRRKGRPEGTEKVCKIFTVDGAAFSVGGLARDTSGYFNANRVIAEVVRKRLPAQSALPLIEESLTKALVSELERIRAADPLFFPRIVAEDEGRVLSFLLATIEEGKPSAVSVSFQAKELPEGKIGVNTSKRRCPGDCDGNDYIFMLGETGPIEAYLKEHGTRFKMPPADVAEFLVQLVTDAMPGKVDPPIDVLVVAPNGISWERKKPECNGSP